MKISVVINSRDEGHWLRDTVENLADTLPSDREILVVDDGSEDGSADFLRRNRKLARLIRNPSPLGMPVARNRGARRSTGGVIVFSDAHMRYGRDWWRPLVDTLERPKVGAAASIVGATNNDAPPFGYGFTLPRPDLAPAWIAKPKTNRMLPSLFLPGCCLGMKREVFEATGGYDEGFRTRGSVDAELGIRFWLLGYENWMAPASQVWHHFRVNAPYPVPHTDAIHNRLRTALVHFSYWRVTQVVQALSADDCVGPALLEVVKGEVAARRSELFAKRIRDDDWLFQKFGIDW